MLFLFIYYTPTLVYESKEKLGYFLIGQFSGAIFPPFVVNYVVAGIRKKESNAFQRTTCKKNWKMKTVARDETLRETRLDWTYLSLLLDSANLVGSQKQNFILSKILSRISTYSLSSLNMKTCHCSKAFTAN